MFEPDYNNGYNKSWPSSGDGYLLRDGTRGLYRLNNCTPRATVCYGAEEDARKDGHWGAYLDGCDEIGDWSCCKTCPASGVREVGTTNLICPGGDSGDVGNGSNGFRSRVRLSDASGRAVGSNVGASKEIGEPNHAGNRGGHSVWWTWTAPASGTFTFDTRGSDFDTLLAVYTGNSVSRLNRVASNDDIDRRARVYQSEVRFRATRGQTYHIAVDGYGGATGNVVLHWQAEENRMILTKMLLMTSTSRFPLHAPSKSSYVSETTHAKMAMRSAYPSMEARCSPESCSMLPSVSTYRCGRG